MQSLHIDAHVREHTRSLLTGLTSSLAIPCYRRCFCCCWLRSRLSAVRALNERALLLETNLHSRSELVRRKIRLRESMILESVLLCLFASFSEIWRIFRSKISPGRKPENFSLRKYFDASTLVSFLRVEIKEISERSFSNRFRSLREFGHEHRKYPSKA